METKDLQTRVFRIGGMTCVHCQNRIEKKLNSMAGIQSASVDYESGKAAITYDASLVTFDEITAAIESLGYRALNGKALKQPLQIAGVVVLILALYMLLRVFGASTISAAFPTAQMGMGYGMLLLIGLLTSVHCISMCGGINLWAGMRTEKGHSSLPIPHALIPAILYNIGRLISYTAVGIVVGALGSVITVSGRFQGAVQLAAGVFMLIMGLNMLGLFPFLRRFTPRMPKIFARKIDEQKTGKGPLIIGVLNGFMPCGPLQAMQLYALSTGSPLRGGIAMFLFCLGTIPLMFALGAASNLLAGAKGQIFSRRVMQVGAVLIAAMGLVMFSNGWNLTGYNNPLDQLTAFVSPISLNSEEESPAPEVQSGVQIINSTLFPNRYPAITVQQGIPVRWTINAPPGSINGCNNRMIIREYNIQHSFKPGDNVIEFLPAKTGRFSYSCWMGMIRGSITVLAKGETSTAVAEPDITPKPAGVNIPTDKIVTAQIMDQGYQTVQIRLGDDGFEPAIVVMQGRLPALWNISIDSLEPGKDRIIFPAYYTVMGTEQGDNPIQIMPSYDFAFSTGDNVFYGYVKVVDDINRVDTAAIKAEVAGFETLIYPETYFELAMGGGGCH